MAYILNWQTPALGATEGKSPISVAVGSVLTSGTGLRFTGKGTANYGQIQQENLLRLLENFASTAANRPVAPTVGQLHFSMDDRKLYVCRQVSPSILWESLSTVTSSATAPANPAIGDMWVQPAGNASVFIYVYTGIGRYPETDPTGTAGIGGWDQLYPQVDVFAGREEYDYMRELVDELVGEAVSTLGNGALRRLFDFTNIGAMDVNLRIAYNARSPDTNVFLSGAGDTDIVKQGLSRLAVISADRDGSTSINANEIYISQTATNSAAGQIYIGTTLTSLPAGTVLTSQQGDVFLLWHRGASTLVDLPNGAGRRYHAVRQLANGSWQYDTNTAWEAFTPTSEMVIIGTASILKTDNTDFPGVDTAYLWRTAVPLTGSKLANLKMEPNSQDWDRLLSAARWALNRLDIPSNVVDAVSRLPFVSDGRPAAPELVALTESDIRYPSALRRASRKGSAVTLVQGFAETVNAIKFGINNRFSLRGVAGNNGTYTAYDAGVTTSTFKTYSFPAPGPTDILPNVFTNVMKFRFNSHDERTRFIASGGVFELRLSHSTAGSLAGDDNLGNYIANHGLIRITGDSVRVFQSNAVPTLTEAPTNLGAINSTTAGKVIYSDGIMSITAQRVTSSTENSIVFSVQLNAGGNGVANATGFNWYYTKDNAVGTIVAGQMFPAPLAYVSNDGSVVWSITGAGSGTTLIA